MLRSLWRIRWSIAHLNLAALCSCAANCAMHNTPVIFHTHPEKYSTNNSQKLKLNASMFYIFASKQSTYTLKTFSNTRFLKRTFTTVFSFQSNSTYWRTCLDYMLRFSCNEIKMKDYFGHKKQERLNMYDWLIFLSLFCQYDNWWSRNIRETGSTYMTRYTLANRS